MVAAAAAAAAALEVNAKTCCLKRDKREDMRQLMSRSGVSSAKGCRF
jgi:hypothetical protein